MPGDRTIVGGITEAPSTLVACIRCAVALLRQLLRRIQPGARTGLPTTITPGGDRQLTVGCLLAIPLLLAVALLLHILRTIDLLMACVPSNAPNGTWYGS